LNDQPATPAVPPLAIEEYKFCKQLIMEDIKWMDQLEVWVVAAIAAVYLFIFTQAKSGLVIYLIFVPFLLAGAGMLRTTALDRTIGVLNDYIVILEKKYPDQIGFTGFYRRKRSLIMRISRRIVWWGLLLGTGTILAVTLYRGPFWPVSP
jgi:hypothetical protein